MNTILVYKIIVIYDYLLIILGPCIWFVTKFNYMVYS